MLVHLYQIYGTFMYALFTYGTVNAKTIGWMGNLIRYARQDIGIYQVVLLFNQRKGIVASEEEKVAYKISSKIPSWVISFQEATTKKAEDLNLKASFYNPYEGTLFLIICRSWENWNLSSLSGPIKFMNQIANSKSRAKCLFVLFHEGKHAAYDHLLRSMWSKQFLDVTILEFTVEEDQEDAVVHIFNPFTNTMTRVKYSSEVIWFPDKTRDLHGYETKVGVFDQPPGTYLQVNDTGHIVGIQGDEIMLVETLSEALNFKILWVQSREKLWGNVSRFKENFTGLARSIIFNEINLVAVQIGPFGARDDNLFVESTNVKEYKLIWVVPIIPSESVVVSFEWKLFNSICLIVLFLTTWIIARLLPFENHNWNSLYMVQIVLGSSTPREPQRVAERIFFGCLLMSCMLHSSYIYSALADIGMQSRKAVEFKTMDELARSTFKPIIHVWIYAEAYQSAEGSVRELLNKSTPLVISFHECLDLFLKMRNISCLVRKDLAQMRIRQDRDSNNDPTMKVVDEPFRVGGKALMLEARSPFASGFNRIILRLKQSGLIEKWERLHLSEPNLMVRRQKDGLPEELKAEPILKTITVILLCAHAFSCIVFVCELAVFYALKQR